MSTLLTCPICQYNKVCRTGNPYSDNCNILKARNNMGIYNIVDFLDESKDGVAKGYFTINGETYPITEATINKIKKNKRLNLRRD